MAAWADRTATAEARARSYLHVNCVHCHGPGGSQSGLNREWGPWDVPLATTDLCSSNCNGLPCVAPGSAATSRIYIRDNALNGTKRMPNLATNQLDPTDGMLLEEWINGIGTCP